MSPIIKRLAENTARRAAAVAGGTFTPDAEPVPDAAPPATPKPPVMYRVEATASGFMGIAVAEGKIAGSIQLEQGTSDPGGQVEPALRREGYTQITAYSFAKHGPWTWFLTPDGHRLEDIV